MPKYEFLKQFQAIGYSMAKKAKAEVLEINELKDRKISEINTNFIENLMKDLREKTENFMRNYETQLNQQISENIKDLNLKILTKKNAMFEDYTQSLVKKIKTHIENNYDAYLKELTNKVNQYLKLFKSTAYLQLNQRDKGKFNKIQSQFGSKKVMLEQKSLESIGGFKLSNRGNTVVVSNTIEDMIEQKIMILRKNFSKIFPEYSDRRKSATELMKERNITISSSLPDELEGFMLQHDIEFPE